MNNVPYGIERIGCFVLKSRMEEVVAHTSFQLDIIREVATELMGSEKIENMLSLVSCA